MKRFSSALLIYMMLDNVLKNNTKATIFPDQLKIVIVQMSARHNFITFTHTCIYDIYKVEFIYKYVYTTNLQG